MKKLGKSVDFYGADPIIDQNPEIYARIGKYFPFAVGSKPGYSVASVQVKSGIIDWLSIDLLIDFCRYLRGKKCCPRGYHLFYSRDSGIEGLLFQIFIVFFKFCFFQKIDNLWMDAEFAEYGLFDIFYQDGIFDKNGIVVCQINMEVTGITVVN